MASLLHLLKRASALPPKTVFRIARRKLRARTDSRWLPDLSARLTQDALLRRMGCETVNQVFDGLIANPPFPRPDTVPDDAFPDGPVRWERVHARTVDLLGSGPVDLGAPIDWARDFKTGHTWPMAPMHTIAINRLDEPCDIKVPWELSRLQWLLPAAQAWRATRDDRHALLVRDVIDEWIAANPIARGPNWVCTMDVALRAVSLVWLATQCADAPAWSDTAFRFRLIKSMWLHGHFVHRHLEWSDVDGNHLLADALGLVVIGAALPGREARDWHTAGWALMLDQSKRQIHSDGGTFEASMAYHRLVLEMVLVASSVRGRLGEPVDASMMQTIRRMADFLSAAIRPDGSVPNWGDADDGRVLPFGPEPVGDFASIAAAAAMLTNEPVPTWPEAKSSFETCFWLMGADAAPSEPPLDTGSQGFGETGAYVLAHGPSHVFIDAGPVGMRGRGGHGHNDCLSFDAYIDGTALIIDPGTYVYTADAAARNRFRSSAAHNGPVVDEEEINRFVSPDLLWMLHDDAAAHVETFEPTELGGRIVASHTGYSRLDDPVRPRRTWILDGQSCALGVLDDIDAKGEHRVAVRLTLAPGVEPTITGDTAIALSTGAKSFVLIWQGDGWTPQLGDAKASPTYGVLRNCRSVEFECTSRGATRLAFGLAPTKDAAERICETVQART